jgi:hypothetical protein
MLPHEAIQLTETWIFIDKCERDLNLLTSVRGIEGRIVRTTGTGAVGWYLCYVCINPVCLSVRL